MVANFLLNKLIYMVSKKILITNNFLTNTSYLRHRTQLIKN